MRTGAKAEKPPAKDAAPTISESKTTENEANEEGGEEEEQTQDPVIEPETSKVSKMKAKATATAKSESPAKRLKTDPKESKKRAEAAESETETEKKRKAKNLSNAAQLSSIKTSPLAAAKASPEKAKPAKAKPAPKPKTLQTVKRSLSEEQLEAEARVKSAPKTPATAAKSKASLKAAPAGYDATSDAWHTGFGASGVHCSVTCRPCRLSMHGMTA